MLARYYVPTDVLLLGDPEVAFLDRALFIFGSGLMRQTELFVVAYRIGQASLHLLAWLAEIDKRRIDDGFVSYFLSNLLIYIFQEMRNRFTYGILLCCDGTK